LPIEVDAFGETLQVPKSEFFRLARAGRIDLHRREARFRLLLRSRSD